MRRCGKPGPGVPGVTIGGIGGGVTERWSSRVGVDGASMDVTAARTVAPIVQLSNVGPAIVVQISS
jgi:hypothetical protein